MSASQIENSILRKHKNWYQWVDDFDYSKKSLIVFDYWLNNIKKISGIQIDFKKLPDDMLDFLELTYADNIVQKLILHAYKHNFKPLFLNNKSQTIELIKGNTFNFSWLIRLLDNYLYYNNIAKEFYLDSFLKNIIHFQKLDSINNIYNLLINNFIENKDFIVTHHSEKRLILNILNVETWRYLASPTWCILYNDKTLNEYFSDNDIYIDFIEKNNTIKLYGHNTRSFVKYDPHFTVIKRTFDDNNKTITNSDTIKFLSIVNPECSIKDVGTLIQNAIVDTINDGKSKRSKLLYNAIINNASDDFINEMLTKLMNIIDIRDRVFESLCDYFGNLPNDHFNKLEFIKILINETPPGIFDWYRNINNQLVNRDVPVYWKFLRYAYNEKLISCDVWKKMIFNHAQNYHEYVMWCKDFSGFNELLVTVSGQNTMSNPEINTFYQLLKQNFINQEMFFSKINKSMYKSVLNYTFNTVFKNDKLLFIDFIKYSEHVILGKNKQDLLDYTYKMIIYHNIDLQKIINFNNTNNFLNITFFELYDNNIKANFLNKLAFDEVIIFKSREYFIDFFESTNGNEFLEDKISVIYSFILSHSILFHTSWVSKALEYIKEYDFIKMDITTLYDNEKIILKIMNTPNIILYDVPFDIVSFLNNNYSEFSFEKIESFKNIDIFYFNSIFPKLNEKEQQFLINAFINHFSSPFKISNIFGISQSYDNESLIFIKIFKNNLSLFFNSKNIYDFLFSYSFWMLLHSYSGYVSHSLVQFYHENIFPVIPENDLEVSLFHYFISPCDKFNYTILSWYSKKHQNILDTVFDRLLEEFGYNLKLLDVEILEYISDNKAIEFIDFLYNHFLENKTPLLNQNAFSILLKKANHKYFFRIFKMRKIYKKLQLMNFERSRF